MTLKIDPPSEKQRQFLTDTHRHVCYGGARGGGKSWAVRTKAKLLALRHPGIKILIVRLSYQELYNNHISILAEELSGICRYNDSKKMLTFPNGSIIKFGYCCCERDVLQYQGAEYDVIFFDEATNLREGWIRKICACCRGVNAFPKRVYYTCNPGGVGHNYIKRLFVDRRYEAGEDPDNYSFIQASVMDNPALLRAQPEYVDELKNLPPKLRKAWLEGRWDILSGAFFEEFRDDPAHYRDGLWTHVIDPLPLSEIRRMNIYRSYDFGYNKPFSAAWWGVDGDGVIYRLLEYYGWSGAPDEGLRIDADRQFAKMREIEGSHPFLAGHRIVGGVADPAIWNSQSGESVADVAERHGIYFEPADNSRIAGWMQMRYRMQFDTSGRARMYFFKNCEAIRRTMPLMQFSSTHPEDLDTTLEDHALDEARYFCMSRPVKPLDAEPKEPVMPRYDPLG